MSQTGGSLSPMTISPVSGITPLNNSQTVRNQAGSTKASGSSQNNTDTVQLSPAALAHLQGGDADHDGDSH